MPDAGPHSAIIIAPSILSAGLGRLAEEVLPLPHNIILDICAELGQLSGAVMSGY
jgi:hypothetical protein